MLTGRNLGKKVYTLADVDIEYTTLATIFQFTPQRTTLDQYL